MPDNQIDKINNAFLDIMNDINEYLMDDSVPLECYSEDIDRKLKDGFKKILEMLKA
jgi:hypothetical protein